MSECKAAVTTKSGTFTYYNEAVPRCKARLNCANRGHILAPFTNQEDIDAVYGIMNLDCDFYAHRNKFHIGLDIKKCGNDQIRIFSNNVVWNQAKHGPLYKDYLRKNFVCPVPYMQSARLGKKPLLIVEGRRYCETVKMGYICLSPAN